MLAYLKTYLLYGNHFGCVEHASKEDRDILYVYILKKTRKELDTKTTFNTKTIDEFAEKLSRKHPISLIINNAHVLSKQIIAEQAKEDQLVYKAFPNIKLIDFHYEIVTHNKSHFISICRRSYIKELLNTYKKHGLPIINLSLGNNIVSTLPDFLTTNELVTSNAKITFEDNQLNTIEKVNEEKTLSYNINGLLVDSISTLSFSGALQPSLKNFNPTTNFDTLKNDLKSNHNQLRFFNLFLRFGLVFILTTLLINFFVFNHYFSEVSSLQQTSQVNLTSKEKVLQLTERVNKSQKMVDDMLKGGQSKSAFYLNAMIKTLPGSILLSEFNYQPVKKTIKFNKPIESNLNTIIVSGSSSNSEDFSKWLLSIETLKWVGDVDILNYEDVLKPNSNFSLKLNIDHER